MNISYAATFTVNVSNDQVDSALCANATCSLPEAILQANGNNSLSPNDIINFDNSVTMITLSQMLPIIGAAALPGAITITGLRNGLPGVTITGNSTVMAGLRIQGANAANSKIEGLVINDFVGHGVEVSGTSNITIEKSYIGTDASGSFNTGNNIDGVYFADVSLSTIQDNVISGNGKCGIEFVRSFENTIISNKIGTDFTGMNLLANGVHSLCLYEMSNQNTIGDTNAENIIGTPGGINGISPGAIIHIEGSEINTIESNHIGVDDAGSSVLVPSTGEQNGIYFINSPSNEVLRNIISGVKYGVVAKDLSHNISIEENTIGLDITRNIGLNSFSAYGSSTPSNVFTGGVLIQNSNNASIKNNFMGDFWRGIFIEGGTGFLIEENHIGRAANGGTIPVIDGIYLKGVSVSSYTNCNCKIIKNLVKNLFVPYQSSGVFLFALQNIEISENTVSGFRSNIELTYTDDIIIKKNSLVNGINHGLRGGTIKNIQIVDNVFDNNQYYHVLYLISAEDTLIESNEFTNNGIVPGIIGLASQSFRNKISKNIFRANSSINIDLNVDGLTVNDFTPNYDADAGPNNLQNTFDFTTASYNQTLNRLELDGALKTDQTSTNYEVEFYLSTGAEAEKFLTSKTVTTNANGEFFYNILNAISLQPNEVVSTPYSHLLVSVTDPDGNTSEFSTPVALTGVPVNSINPQVLEASFFPNPFLEKTNLSVNSSNLSSFNLEIYDIQGKSVFRSSLASETTVIDMSQRAAGVYKAILVNTETGLKKVFNLVKN